MFTSAGRRRRRRLKRYPLQVRHKQDWGRGFILLLPQTAALPGLDAGSDAIKPASSFVIQNRHPKQSVSFAIKQALVITKNSSVADVRSNAIRKRQFAPPVANYYSPTEV